MNIRLILSMHWLKPSKRLNRPPRALWLPTIDTPITPMPIGTLRRGLEAALPVIEEGWGVLAHCRAGVHRSVAMASCVLIGMGDTADDAMNLVARQRDVADPHVWYIRRRIEGSESRGKKGLDLFPRFWRHKRSLLQYPALSTHQNHTLGFTLLGLNLLSTPHIARYQPLGLPLPKASSVTSGNCF